MPPKVQAAGSGQGRAVRSQIAARIESLERQASPEHEPSMADKILRIQWECETQLDPLKPARTFEEFREEFRQLESAGGLGILTAADVRAALELLDGHPARVRAGQKQIA